MNNTICKRLNSHYLWCAALFCIGWMMVSQACASGSEQLRAFVTQVQTAKGEFVQRQLNATAKNARGTTAGLPANSQMAGPLNGTFMFARPGRFIWAYQKPYEQILQADGVMLYVYDKDLNQVTERELTAALGASPAAILFGSNDFDANFRLRDIGAQEGIDWLELMPKSQDTQFQKVEIGFRDGTLAVMKLYDAFGNITLLTLSHIVKNPPLAADQFKFVAPKGVDLIKGE